MAYLIGDDIDDRTISASIHGLVSRSNLDYYRDRLESKVSRVSGFASKWMSRAIDTVRDFDLDGLKDGIDNLRNRYGRRWDADRILGLDTLEDVQQAKTVMRRWMMANTRARKGYYEDRLSGYDGKWNQTEGAVYGDELYDYRNVMQGAEIGDEEEDRFVTYLDILEDTSNDELLTPDQRDFIRHSWDMMEMHLDVSGQDPTSPHKNLL